MVKHVSQLQGASDFPPVPWHCLWIIVNVFIINGKSPPMECCQNCKSIIFFWERRNVCMWRGSISRRARDTAQNPTRHSTTRNRSSVEDRLLFWAKINLLWLFTINYSNQENIFTKLQKLVPVTSSLGQRTAQLSRPSSKLNLTKTIQESWFDSWDGHKTSTPDRGPTQCPIR